MTVAPGCNKGQEGDDPSAPAPCHHHEPRAQPDPVVTPASPASNLAGIEPVIRANGIWKIFGPKADSIIGTPDANMPRAELRAKT